VGSARLGGIVWPGMILAGLALAAAVLAAWPEPTTRIVRLPYGESLPKTPALAQAARPEAPARAVSAPPSGPSTVLEAAEPEAEPARVLAAVEPAPEEWAGPAPVQSETELDEDYVQESPEQLGADPLPGSELTPPPPPVAG
jgi:hypothetical protein